VQVSVTTSTVASAAIGVLPGLVASQTFNPISAKRCCHRHTAGRLTPMLLRHPLGHVAIRRAEHDVRPRDALARSVAVSRDCCQLHTLSRTQNHTYLLRHGRYPHAVRAASLIQSRCESSE
jgi:hypothetical protein